MSPYRRTPEVARAQALDYLRQIGDDPLAAAAHAALEAGDVALAQSIVQHMQGERRGNLADACVDYARRALRDVRTPDLPSVSRARFEAWRASRTCT